VKLAARPAMPAILRPMKLIFLHGSPAVGKLTVAKALLRLVPARLMDNHANVDLARTVFDFGVPGFWELVHASRCVALRAAGKHGVPLLVTTYCYVEPADRAHYEEFEAIVRRYDGEMLPVFLHCPHEEALRRVGNPDRIERRKVTSAEGLIDFLDGRNFTSVPREECIKFDTGVMPPDAVAREIVGRFGLDNS
jgi:chloramphenicol 3-O-phosphotransferase